MRKKIPVNAEKRREGRPTKLTPELISAVKEYIETYEPYELVMTEVQKKNGDVHTVQTKIPNDPPCILSLHTWLKEKKKIKINRCTLYDWNEKNAEFSNTFKRVQYLKYDYVCNGALSGKINPLFAKYYLCNERHPKTGLPLMTDEKKIDHTTRGKSFSTYDLSKTSTEDIKKVLAILNAATTEKETGQSTESGS